MALAPPVSRDSFFYNGNLYVDVGNLSRHQRAPVEEITAILRPDLNKSKTKSSVDPPKDPVGHWYEAQLIHYGLPPSKDKARAKMRLLEALNQSKLIVPPNIAKIEAEMKKEYTAAERKAKAQYKASIAPAKEGETSAASKKRKQPESSGNFNNVNVSISFGNGFQGPSSAVNAAFSQSPAKKAKTGPSKPTNKNTDKTASSKPPKKTTELGIEQELPQAQRSRPIQTARRSIPTAGRKSAAAKQPIVKKDSKVKPEPKIGGKTEVKKEVKKEVGVKKEPKVKNESKAEKEVGIKKEPKVKKEVQVKKESPAVPPSSIKHEATANPRSVGLINGLYDLSCDTVEDEWSCTDLTLTLTLEGTTVWGAYDLGMFSGIVFLPQRPYQASNEPLSYTWRGRENSEGQMSFGHGCDGEITFLGNGDIEGWISVYGRCSFSGVRRPGAGTGVRTARSMRTEWEEFNERAYDEENAARWR